MKRGKQGKPFIVTIDGPAGSGKSTVAKNAAERTGLRYLDTGKLYRAIAFFLSGKGIPAVNDENLVKGLGNLLLELEAGRVSVAGEDVTEDLHTPDIDKIVSLYAALPAVRDKLLLLQRAQAVPPGLVADGRDMGSVVFPSADLKIFLTADARERARRRFLEQSSRGETVDFEQVLSIVRSRDRTDSTRTIAPLVVPENALVIDTTAKSAREVIDEIVLLIEKAREQSENMEESDVL